MRVAVPALGCLIVSTLAGPVDGGPARPQLSLRALPRVAFGPGGVLFTGELRGGEDSEEYHCPALEWDWDDGTRSSREHDCEPFQTATRIERHFSERHVYRAPGSYLARLTLSRAGRSIAAATVRIEVRGLSSSEE